MSVGFMISAIGPQIIAIEYDMIGTHYVLKWIIVILFGFMSFSIISMQGQKKPV
ncbi:MULTISPECIES: hypothetical protein [Solibacillus]|uniref:hypothetical protein n=1 Tax=Solibacillus TaxID=648800 RepID=UPI00203CCBDB|nr:hypothetical protein [Solibacillus isronensis]MCM3721370.1 hypothetical protein [Solibacillus isronensis]